MVPTTTRMIALVALLVGAGYPLAASHDGATAVVAAASPPCVLINRPPAPFADRFTAGAPTLPLPAPGMCMD